MNWLKRLFHSEKPELIELPKSEITACPICGKKPVVFKLETSFDFCWRIKDECEHSPIINSFACSTWNMQYDWNSGCQGLKSIIDAPMTSCPVCGELPCVQLDSKSYIPQLVCSCNELLPYASNIYLRKEQWICRCDELKRKQDNVTEMEQLIGETQ